MELDKAIEQRKSSRKFSTKKPDWRKLISAIEMALKIPLAGNIPTVKFILVDDKNIIKKLADACQQDFIAQAHYVIAVCSEPKDAVRFYDKRGETYAKQQAGAAIEQLLLKLTDIGLGSCWVGDYVDEQVKFLLKVPDDVYIEAIIPVGYSMDKTRRKTKPSLDRCLYFNAYRNKRMRPAKLI